MKRLLFLFAAVVLTVALLAPSLSNADANQAAPEKASYVPGEVIVKYKEGTSKAEISAMHKKESATVTSLNKEMGFEVVKVKGKSVNRAVQSYKNNPNVEYAEPNYYYHASWTPNDPLLPHLSVGATKNSGRTAWDRTRGNGVRIAIIDTGVQYNHPDLQGKVVRGYNLRRSKLGSI